MGKRFGKILAFAAAAAILACAAAAPEARAARDALVMVEGSWILGDPTEDGERLYKCKQGDILRVSERDLNGWYKAVLPEERYSKKFGWIEAKNLSQESFASDMQAFSAPT